MDAEKENRLLQEYLSWRANGFKRDVKLALHRKRSVLHAPHSGNHCWQSCRPVGPNGVPCVLSLVHDVSSDEFCLCIFDTVSREERRAQVPSGIARRLRGDLLDVEQLLQSVTVDVKGRVVFPDACSGHLRGGEEAQTPAACSADPEVLTSGVPPSASPGPSGGGIAGPLVKVGGDGGTAEEGACENGICAGGGDGCAVEDAPPAEAAEAATRAESPARAAEEEVEASRFAPGPVGSVAEEGAEKAGGPAVLGDAADADVAAWVQATKKLLVYVCTWNMMGKDVPPREGLRANVLPPDRYHVYVVGTQECERSIAKSALNPAKKVWEAAVQDSLGDRYHKISSHTLQATNLIAFVHGALEHMVHGVATSAVACGIGNTMGNKGGIGLRFSVADSDLCFVTAHLSASRDANGAAQRSADFRRISTGLARALSTRTVADERSIGEGREAYRCLLPHFDHVFFFGDLNYRLEGGERDAVVAKIDQGSAAQLLVMDQLTMERERGSAFVEYCEGALGFAPTYKFDKGVDVYDTGPKRRCPAWTDRVLYKAGAVELVEYGCHLAERLSDHRPVYGVFAAALDLGDGMHGDKDRGSIGRTESQVCSIQ